MITHKPDAHCQTTTETPGKFQKDQLNKVRGVASTNYPSHCVYEWIDRRTDGRTRFNSPLRLTSVGKNLNDVTFCYIPLTKREMLIRRRMRIILACKNLINAF